MRWKTHAFKRNAQRERLTLTHKQSWLHGEEIEHLGAELAEVRQQLHDSQEREARASEDAETTRTQLEVEQSLQQQKAGDAKLIEQLHADTNNWRRIVASLKCR